jgi:hypothetical protein
MGGGQRDLIRPVGAPSPLSWRRVKFGRVLKVYSYGELPTTHPSPRSGESGQRPDEVPFADQDFKIAELKLLLMIRQCMI